MHAKITGIFQIAAVYVGTVVGAGFATGREIAEFFTQYGLFGLFGIVLAGLVFVWMGTKIMLIALKIKAASYQELNRHLFGKRWGILVNGLFFIMLLGVSAVMLSGAGAVFEEHLHIPKVWGVILTSLLALLILMQGMKGLIAINIVVVPLMIFFSFLLLWNGIKQPHFLEDALRMPATGISWGSTFSPILYSAFNLALAAAVLVPTAAEIKDVNVIKGGGIAGGIALTAILVSGHLALSTLPDVLGYSIPSAELMKQGSSVLYYIFLLVVYGEIFTSLVGNTFGLERQLRTIVKAKSLLIYVSLLAVAYLIGQFEYGALLSFLYPLFGYVSTVFLVLLFRSSQAFEGE
ncbi:YkvI family membrane protein [Bacillus testis]|uniref:YkvI family membrane protein n=1 Tax=Bacillus testis TaxID=1622072 RepID=UPI00067ED06A|nr:hypothetical protein [Bacillus testis]